jgi:hypothetical protein
MKRALIIAATLSTLISVQPAGAEDFEPFFRITPQAGYIEPIMPPETSGLVIMAQGSWGARWQIGAELLYARTYDYEHAYEEKQPGDPDYGEPSISNALWAEVVGGYFIGNPRGFGGHVELGFGTYEFRGIAAHLDLGFDLALGEDIGLIAEGRAGMPFYWAATMGVTFYIHP